MKRVDLKKRIKRLGLPEIAYSWKTYAPGLFYISFTRELTGSEQDRLRTSGLYPFPEGERDPILFLLKLTVDFSKVIEYTLIIERTTKDITMTERARDRKKLIERVQKLLELTVENGATPEEAANAAARAQEMLLKYNIEEAEIAKSRNEEEPIELEIFEIAKSQGDLKEWRRTLIFAIARTNFCKGYAFGSYKMGLLGRRTNIEVAKQIYQSLFNQLNILLERDIKRAKDLGAYGGQGNGGHRNARKWRSNWLMAASEVVEMRLMTEWKRSQVRINEERKEAGTYTESTSALMVINNEAKALEAEQNKRFGDRLGQHKSYTTYDPYAFASQLGSKAGTEVQITTGLNATNRREPEKLR